MSGTKNSWKKEISKLCKSYSKKQKYRMISISLTLLVVTVLFAALFTLYVGVESSLGKYEADKFGTEAHGQIFYQTKKVYDKIKNDSLISDSAYSHMLGTLCPNFNDSKKYYLCYDQGKMLEWEKINITGEYPKNKNEIVVSTRLLSFLGLQKKADQMIKLNYQTMGKRHTDSFKIVGYYESKDNMTTDGLYDGNFCPGTYEKIYISDKLCKDRLKAYSAKDFLSYYKHDKSNGDGLLQVQIKLPHNYLLSKQVQQIEKKYKKYFRFSGILLNSGWERLDPFEKDFRHYFIIALFVICIGAVGVFVVSSVFKIPILEDRNFWGLLQTLGVNYRQYRYFLLLQMRSYTLYGILSGGIIGYIVGYMLIPVVTKNFYNGNVVSSMGFRPWIIIVCVLLSLIISYICCFKVARDVVDLSPKQLTGVFMTSRKKKSKKRIYKGKYKEYIFAYKKIYKEIKQIIPSISSFGLILFLVMVIFTFLSSINYKYYIQNWLGDIDFVVVSQDTMNGDEHEECASALEKLSQKVNCKGKLIGESEKELVLSSNFAPKKQKGIFDTTEVKKYLNDNGLLNPYLPEKEHQVSLRMFGIDYNVVNKFNVVDGSIEDKYNSGKYVILTSEVTVGERDGATKEYKNPLYALYKVGDKIKLYGKEYEVMAVVDMPNVINSVYYANELPVIMPYDEVLSNDNSICTYGEVYNFKQGNKQIQKETMINEIMTVYNNELEYVSKESMEQQLRGMSKMLYSVSIIVLSLLIIILMIHTANTTGFSITNEKHTYAVLQSIGMKRKRQRRQIMWESVIQIAIAGIVVMILGSVVSVFIIKGICESSAIFIYHYTFLPVIVLGILLFLIKSASAVISYDKIWRKYNVIELLKER